MKPTKIAKRAAVKRLRMLRYWFSLLYLPILLGAILDTAGAQGLSSRPITIVVPYSPCTGPAVISRNIGEELQKPSNQAFGIDNKAGAKRSSGPQIVPRPARDGHTLHVSSKPFYSNGIP